MNVFNPRPATPSTREAWRPMGFKFGKTKHVKDPVCEPFWAGSRALADVRESGVVFRDEEGDEVEGFRPLRDALVEAVLARELVLDGYLLPAPLRGSVGADDGIGEEVTPTSGQMGRQMLFGGGAPHRKEERLSSEERVIILEPNDPAAFMAIDILWLDGESLLNVPLMERKRLLESVLLEGDLVRRTMVVRPPVEPWYRQWRALGFRAFVTKSANSRYRPGVEADDWTANVIPAS